MNKLDCLLISPSNLRVHSVPYPYLGLCYLAAVLRQAGVKVGILDSDAQRLGVREIINHVKSCRPLIIGISVMSMNLRSAYNLIKNIQLEYPEGKIVVGGAHINGDPGIIEHMGVEYGFRGECEFAFLDFCRKTLNGEECDGLPGLILNRSGEINAGHSPFIGDINSLPMPAYDLLPLQEYYTAHTNIKAISMITSRGCPYNCIYCSRLRQGSYRYLSSEKTLEQLEVLVGQHGFQSIEFVDEIFTFSRERVIELCRSIIKRKLRFSWGVLARADKVDDEILGAMKEAGCRSVAFGVESGSERVRFLDNKKIKNEVYFKAIDLCRKHKLQTMGFYILGHPTETKEEMIETVRFALKLGTDMAKISKMIPLPNSLLFDKAVTAGEIEKDAWLSYMLEQKKQHPLYYPKSVPQKTMDRIYRYAWLRFYLSPKTVLRNIALLFKPKQLFDVLKIFFNFISSRRYE